MIVENIIPRNVIINLGCASVDNHIPRDDIFDYHPRRECNIYILPFIITAALQVARLTLSISRHVPLSGHDDVVRFE